MARILVQRRAEARQRARLLGAPAVWVLARDPGIQEVAQHLDPSGGLQAEVNRACAGVAAEVVGRPLVRGGRPLADRSYREQAWKPAFRTSRAEYLRGCFSGYDQHEDHLGEEPWGVELPMFLTRWSALANSAGPLRMPSKGQKSSYYHGKEDPQSLE